MVAMVLIVSGYQLTLGASQAEAYATTGCKFGSKTITWNYYSPNSGIQYQSQWVNSASKWHNATKLSVTQGPASSADMLFYAASWGNNGWDGYAPDSFNCKKGVHAKGMHVYLNTHYAAGYTSAMRESVMVHEIGHYLGLQHVGSSTTVCSSVTIMNPFTSRRWSDCSVNAPRADDINGVNAQY